MNFTRPMRSLAGLCHRRPAWFASAALALALAAGMLPDATQAQGSPPAASAPAADADAATRAWEAANAAAAKAARPGPQDITLGEQAVLKLPAGMVFIPPTEAMQLLNAMGNPGQDPRLQGLVHPVDSHWFLLVSYEPSGYIRDDDAKAWNTDELLASFREGTEASNEQRRQQGITPIEIVGWAEKPAYDAATHRLAWALASRDVGAPAGAPQGVNYNTYLLGREGYYSLNLVTDLDKLATHKPAAQALLGAMAFNDGKRYADFNSSTDKVAEYGLAALVVGAAAKKLGFLAVALAFVAKFAKVILLALGLGGAGLARWFKRKPKAGGPAG